jgi:4-hydroxy-3-polyprenylbenzoate decarboxylase
VTHKSIEDAVRDLEAHGHLVRIRDAVDPYLEMAYIQRRIYSEKGPAVLFENVKGSKFPAVSNLFGTLDRCHFMFRRTLAGAKSVIAAKADPAHVLKNPSALLKLPGTLFHALPQKRWSGSVLSNETTIDQIPQIQGWPKDGGAFITLPQVFTEDPRRAGVMHANVGMYRVQLGGNDYVRNKEIGLHYQIHRGIGVHHHAAIHMKKPLPVSIFVGGPPAHTLAAIMPLPEGLSEVVFAGMLAGRGFRYTRRGPFVISSDADFCITGFIEGEKLEGPFGDHLGYYSLAHDFPCLKVANVYHRANAIWPFTSVGRPPQEDTSFGAMIHELTAPMVPVSIPGVQALHAVDEAGVHPLLMAVGTERYVPYQSRAPREILTQAHAILGFGQASLAKYLFIAAHEDKPNIHDIPKFFQHMLQRVRWQRDLHFSTNTTIDTLDYSGQGLNQGSKLVVAAAGEPWRDLPESWSCALPQDLQEPMVVFPGVAVITAPPFLNYDIAAQQFDVWGKAFAECPMPLIVMVDRSSDCKNLADWLWVTFTRSNPSHDVYGVGSFQKFKHWGCEGALMIDARTKPHHAPGLVDDPIVKERMDKMWDRWFSGA